MGDVLATRGLYLLLGSCLLVSASDTVYLRDGKTIAGSYLGGDSRQIRMVVGEKIQTFSIPDISKIEFGSAATASSGPPAAVPAPETKEGLQPSRIGTSQPAQTAATSADIPSGTNLVVRLIDAVDSQTDRIGQTYRASLDEPVVLNGETIIARGADVIAKLVDDKQSGKLTGQTVLTLDLVSITVGNKKLEIDTEEVTQSSASRTARSAKVIGGVTALGAVIGAIAGGGKGAAVGAVSGAGAGTAAQVMTKGQTVKIPSETRLTFTLQNAVKL
jgi:hypothetical protein